MRKIFYPIALALALGAGLASAAGEWTRDSETGCELWSMVALKNMGVRWVGACEDGKANGPGALFTFWEKDRARAVNPNCIGCDAEIWVGTMQAGRFTGEAEVLQGGQYGKYNMLADGKKERITRIGVWPEDTERVKAVVRELLEQ